MGSIPCFNFPTKLLIVDDDKDLIRNLQLAIKKQYRSVCFTELDQAAELIKQNKDWVQSIWGESLTRIYQDIDPGLFTVSMDVTALKK